ncbi:hypothetical protein M5K25_002883 [Dendrobium thyrsiflorum]|uniref:Uncharacterized protein n=1 Tax=Dendrobium thyrsiflorum TaxID=117978 RepID=A0ABD0VPH6_DENTH
MDDVAPWVLDGFGLLAGGLEIGVFLVDVIGAADFAEHVEGLLLVAALDEGVGGVGEEEGAEGDDGGGDGGEGEADAPAPAPFDLGAAVVDEACGENANCDHELEADVEHASEFGRCHF